VQKLMNACGRQFKSETSSARSVQKAKEKLQNIYSRVFFSQNRKRK
jgi:hypothetical protein